jgi:hypothetical protein
MSVIDDTLQRYQNMSAQAQMATPGAYNPGTPMPNSVAMPSQVPPIYSLQMEPGSVMSAQAMAYQQIRQNYMSPATAFQAGGSFANYPNPSQMTSPGMGSFRQALMPAPPPMTMTPGVTGSFVNPYDAAVSGRMQAQFNMFGDPSKAASNWGSNRANEFGQKVGGFVGAGVGMMAGGPWGAATGYGLGDMLGGVLGEIPGVGWAASLSSRGAIQQMSQGTRLQAGTHGAISMGGRDIGLGGRGMSAQAGLGLGRQLKGFADESNEAFNINDMINLTSSAAENGLLSGATNTDQIFDSVKRLTGLVGKIAKLTGDPDFKNNIREIANLRNAGFDLSQIPTVMESMNTSARMAGMTRGQAMQAGGLQGGAIFANAGLTSGLGTQMGIAQAAQTVMAGGIHSDRLLSLMGGTSGSTQRGTESDAAFLSGAGKLILPYLMGEGGKELDPERIQKMLSGEVGMQQMIGQGAGSMDRKSLQNILMHTPELMTQLGEQIGPHGLQLAKLRMAQDVQRQMGGPEMMSLAEAAVPVFGGDKLTALKFAGEWESPVMRERLETQLKGTRSRDASKARQEAAERMKGPNYTTEEWASNMESRGDLGGALAGLFARSGAGIGDVFTQDKEKQNIKAEKMAIELQRKEDEAQGVRSVYGPKWSPLGKAEQAAMEGMTGSAMPTEVSGHQKDLVSNLARDMGMSSDYFMHDTSRLVTSMSGTSYVDSGKHADFTQEKIDKLRKQMETEGGYVKGAEERIKDSKKWEKRLAVIQGVLTPKQRAIISDVVVKEAHAAGVDKKAITWDVLKHALMRALNIGSSRDFAQIEELVRDFAYSILSTTGDKAASFAYNKLLNTTGAVSSMTDIDAINTSMTEKLKAGRAALKEAGLTGEGVTSDDAEKALGQMSNESPEVQAAAITLARSEQEGASIEQKEEWQKIAGTDAGKKAVALVGSLSSAGKKFAANVGAHVQSEWSTADPKKLAGFIDKGYNREGPLGEEFGMRPDVERLRKQAEGLTTPVDPKTAGRTVPGTNVDAQQLEKLIAALPTNFKKFGESVNTFADAVKKVPGADLSGIPANDSWFSPLVPKEKK